MPASRPLREDWRDNVCLAGLIWVALALVALAARNFDMAAIAAGVGVVGVLAARVRFD